MCGMQNLTHQLGFPCVFPGVTNTSSSSGHGRAKTACPHSAVLSTQRDSQPKEAQGRGQEVPEGVWDGESRHVVYRLPLEEGLPEVHRLRQAGGLVPRATANLTSCCKCWRKLFSSEQNTLLEPRGSTSRNFGGIRAKKARKPSPSLLLLRIQTRAAETLYFLQKTSQPCAVYLGHILYKLLS